MRSKLRPLYLIILTSLVGMLYLPVFGKNENKKDEHEKTVPSKPKVTHKKAHHKKEYCGEKVAQKGVKKEASKWVSSERLVFIRHGEKPAKGLGQLSCQGLNRSLALPNVLIGRFGRPDKLFAPNPSYRKPDFGESYEYIRPLATIEPTAIRLGMSVNTQYGFDQVSLLKSALLEENHKNSQIWVAWEHKEIVNVEKEVLKEFGVNPDLIVKWDGNEFDRIDILEIHRNASGVAEVIYRKQKEGLDGLPKKCPELKVK